MDVSARVPVLVVEDDEAIRDSLRFALDEGGYSVSDVGTAQEALDYLRAAAFAHVVLLDYLLPRDKGSVVLQAVEVEPRLRRHAYVLVTVARIGELDADEQRVVSAVTTEVVSKPFDIDELLRAVERAGTQVRVNSRP